jgi:hypothetical protein
MCCFADNDDDDDAYSRISTKMHLIEKTQTSEVMGFDYL